MTGPEWDRALAEVAREAEVHAPLLQSWGYGEVQAEEGWTPQRLDLRSTGGALAGVLLAGRGRTRWAYVPRGPVPATPAALRALADWASGEGLARLRVEPEAPEAFRSSLVAAGFRPAPTFHPAHTLILRLGPEPAMLAGFKPKTRYNVRLAEKRGVSVQIEDDPGELERQGAGTAARQQIALLARDGYERRLRQLPESHIYVARHQGTALAAILVSRFAGRAYYLFGGSTGERRELMPTYAVQWAAIRDAAGAGCVDYDFWGIPPGPDRTHPWHGLWQFKTGFGGDLVAYAGAWDLVLNPAAQRLLEARERARRALRKVARLRTNR
ncbi:MAG TPA: peptidoglycan bridge formation glycyltransferase FemA/FemB family protein [Candidatus Dormibacteraeota bacterium]